MKTLRFFGALLVMVLCVSLTACSDDDDDYNAEDLIGTWELTRSQGWEIDEDDDDEKYEWNEKESDDFYEFKANGTGYEYWGSSKKYPIKWTLRGDQLTVESTDFDDDIMEYTIKELTDTKLLLFYSWNEEGYKGEETYTFKRVVTE